MTVPAGTSALVPDGLDWQAFSAACFPGRRRHDFEALTAYGAYRRSRPVDAQPPTATAQIRVAESTTFEDWEDEGGATR